MDDTTTGGSKPQAFETTLGKGWVQIIILPRIHNVERANQIIITAFPWIYKIRVIAIPVHVIKPIWWQMKSCSE